MTEACKVRGCHKRCPAPFLLDLVMTKLSVLKHKIIRAYNNPKNWEYSRFKGYPEGTYFGYDSLDSLIKDTVKQFKAFYGKGLKKWRYN